MKEKMRSLKVDESTHALLVEMSDESGVDMQRIVSDAVKLYVNEAKKTGQIIVTLKQTSAPLQNLNKSEPADSRAAGRARRSVKELAG